MKRPAAGLPGALLIALLIGSLGGCIPTQKGDIPPDWVAQRDALEQLTNWSLEGRISVTLADRGFSGALRWQQRDKQMQVDINGPLGIGAFRISGSADALDLDTGDGQLHRLDDPDDALRAELGFGVPIVAMPYWMLGLPYPHWPAIEKVDAQGRLLQLVQDDWTVNYDRYTPTGTWLMPRKLVVEGRDAKVKLVIHTWRLAATEP